MSMTTTFYDQGGIVIGNPVYEDGLLSFAGADTFAAGTILSTVGVDANTRYWIPADPTASDGSEILKGILTIASTRTGAGQNSVRVLVGGKVRRDKLLFDNGEAVTDFVADDLRDFGILALEVDETNILDNV
jgi:hypothetical protein